MNQNRPPASVVVRAAAAALFVAALGALLLAGTGTADLSAADRLHLELRDSDPKADSTIVEAPSEVRLFFSEPPQMHGTSVRLVTEDEELVETTDAVADEEDPRQVFITPGEDVTLEDGTYTVMWRVIAQDGHAQRGEFVFHLVRD
ncbi:MAG: copper resistance protein CopC [Gemmatimonadales bacterium]|nr:MAG: copper resistance protein CopC [Gemmatimonadales bacterium]